MVVIVAASGLAVMGCFSKYLPSAFLVLGTVLGPEAMELSNVCRGSILHSAE